MSKRHALAALLALWAPAQTPPPPTFPSGVEVITVDVVVLDDEGRPVSGLTREDFVVKEDGQPQEIVGFESFVAESGPAAPAAGAPSPVASNETAVRAGRAFAILVDDLGLTLRDVAESRRAITSFVQRSLRDGDEVVLATTSGDAWWTARLPEGRADLLALAARLKPRSLDPTLAIDHMSDYEAFAINSFASAGLALQRVVGRWVRAGLCQPPMCDTMVRSRAVDLDGLRRTRLQATLQAVRRVVQALAPIRGRKSLLLFSRGFVEDPEAGLREVVALSREANAAVYFINARGLEGLPSAMSAAEPGPAADPGQVGAMMFEDGVLESAGAQSLAEETGGFSIRNTNDLARGADRVADESRIFYLLGFHPPADKPATQWRKLRVEVRGKGLKVRARRGYDLRRVQPAAGFSVQRALDSPRYEDGVPLRAMAYVLGPRPKDTTRVLIAAEFEASRLLPAKGARARSGTVELSLVVTQRDGPLTFRSDEQPPFTVAEGEDPAWRAVARELDLPAGVFQARVVVRDPAGGAIGSVSRRFEVPASGTFRLSTPIVTNRLAPSTGKRPRAALAVHRVFPPQANLYCEFEVFGGSPAAGGKAPAVSAGFTLRDGEGRVVRQAPPTPIAPAADGRLVRMVGMGLEGMEPAAYEIVLEVRDHTSGAIVEQRESFTLARETPAPSPRP